MSDISPYSQVYFVGNGEEVKIGMSEKPKIRIRTVMRGFPGSYHIDSIITPLCDLLELQLHSCLRYKNIQGEFFRLTDHEVYIIITLWKTNSLKVVSEIEKINNLCSAVCDNFAIRACSSLTKYDLKWRSGDKEEMKKIGEARHAKIGKPFFTK